MEAEKMREAGIAYEEALRRFCGNEALYQKFLKKFLQDHNMELLKDAFQNGQDEEVFRAAHTLKGVCLNLGINRLADACEGICRKFRAEEEITARDIEQAERLHGEVARAIEEEVE